ncbi:hypothetical protein [Falsirhodobacter algicola]|uniref:Uncharacterized protein n=1 Tax=Falsirhodobacter algicola TaxID=2692330 RepID=A0A8J8MR28_9RHOB|nr:hypothetical protein [Falsirhodobacter algicola]QUS35177.1 hypothetical protein GR316_02135 [Falsirhodobacter algicola]
MWIDPERPALAGRSSFGHQQEARMFKFIGGTMGVIFLIGLIVVILLLKLIF